MNLALNARIEAAPGLARQSGRHYYPENGIEVPAVTAYQMREIERIATEETGPDPLYRMERAGLTLALLAADLLNESSHSSCVLVLAGRGAGAEAGICAARHLTELRRNVALCLSNPPFAGRQLSYQHRLYVSAKGREIELWNLHGEKPGLIIDALMEHRCDSFPQGNAAALIRWANSSGAPTLSLDVPSGVNPTTGVARREAIHPQWTLTLGLPKTGLLPELSGKLFLADIGLRDETLRRAGLNYVNPFENQLWVPLACDADAPGLDW